MTAAASGDIAVLPVTFAVQGASQDLVLEAVETAIKVETTVVVVAMAALRLVVDLIGDQLTLNVIMIVLMMVLVVVATVMLASPCHLAVETTTVVVVAILPLLLKTKETMVVVPLLLLGTVLLMDRKVLASLDLAEPLDQLSVAMVLLP